MIIILVRRSFMQAGAPGREGMSRQVLHMLEQLTGEAHEVPTRANFSMFATEDVIAHYIEAEMREAQGETRGCLGAPPTG